MAAASRKRIQDGPSEHLGAVKVRVVESAPSALLQQELERAKEDLSKIKESSRLHEENIRLCNDLISRSEQNASATASETALIDALRSALRPSALNMTPILHPEHQPLLTGSHIPYDELLALHVGNKKSLDSLIALNGTLQEERRKHIREIELLRAKLERELSKPGSSSPRTPPQIPLTVHNRAVLTLGKEIEGLKKERDRAQLKSDAIVKDFKIYKAGAVQQNRERNKASQSFFTDLRRKIMSVLHVGHIPHHIAISPLQTGDVEEMKLPEHFANLQIAGDAEMIVDEVMTRDKIDMTPSVVTAADPQALSSNLLKDRAFDSVMEEVVCDLEFGQASEGNENDMDSPQFLDKPHEVVVPIQHDPVLTQRGNIMSADTGPTITQVRDMTPLQVQERVCGVEEIREWEALMMTAGKELERVNQDILDARKVGMPRWIGTCEPSHKFCR
ncbi:hypothetical protein GGG16DRAFT_119877 [Schizophyllum commune]